MADRKQLLKRGAAEFLIIVTGILTALSVDEFRESRRLAATEQEYLQRLATDLDDSEQSLVAGLAWTKDRAKAGRAVLSYLSGGDDQLTPSQLILASYEVNLVPASAERRLGRRTTYDELLSTGNLVTIRATVVRDALARYYEEYSRIGARLDDAPDGWRNWVRRLLPPDVLLDVDTASSSSMSPRGCSFASASDTGCAVVIPAEVELHFARQLMSDAAFATGDLNQLVQYQDRQISDLEGFLVRTTTLRELLKQSGI